MPLNPLSSACMLSTVPVPARVWFLYHSQPLPYTFAWDGLAPFVSTRGQGRLRALIPLKFNVYNSPVFMVEKIEKSRGCHG